MAEGSGAGAADAAEKQCLESVVREVVSAEARKVRESLTKYVRSLEITHAKVPDTSFPRALKRYSRDVETLQRQLLHMHHQKRRRSMEVSALKDALQEVRSAFNQADSPASTNKLAADQLLTEIRDERERWHAEKRQLEELIRQQEEGLKADQAGQENAVAITDPEKERLKRTVKQLQMSIESRDHYACWICNQRTSAHDADGESGSESGSGGGSEEEQAQENVERKDSSGVEDEVETMRSEVSRMKAELKRLRSGSLSPGEKRTSSKRPVLTKRASRGASSSRSQAEKEPASSMAGGKREAGGGGARPRVQFSASSCNLRDSSQDPPDVPGGEPEAAARAPPPPEVVEERPAARARGEGGVRFAESASVTTEEVVEGNMSRRSRGRIPTPFVAPDTVEEISRSSADGSVASPSPVSREEEASASRPKVRIAVNAQETTEVAVPSEAPMRRSRSRIPTPYVSHDTAASADGVVPAQDDLTLGGSVRFAGAMSTEEVDASGSQPSTASSRGVRFAGSASEGEAASAAAPAGEARSVRGRTPTGFIHEDVDTQSEVSLPSSSAGRGVRFTDDASVGEAAASPPAGGGRSVRGRTPTGFIHEDVEAQSEGSQPSAASSRGVRFRDDASVGEAAASPLAGGGRSVRGRTPTGFIHEDVEAQSEGSQPSAASGRGVRFREGAASEGEAAASPIAGGGRSVRGRTPTGFIHEDIDVQAEASQPSAASSRGVRFRDDASEGDAAGSPLAGGGRSVRGRTPTGFIHEDVDVQAEAGQPSAGSGRGVRFRDDASEGDAAGSPPAGGGRSVRGRTPTGFIHEDVDTQAEASLPSAAVGRGVRFREGASEGEAAASPPAGGGRSVRGRTPTGFIHEDVDVQAEASQPSASSGRGVRFRDDASEGDAAGSPPAGGGRSVRGRTPTGFIHEDVDAQAEGSQPSAASGRGVRFREDASEGDAAASPIEGGGRSVRGRTPTGFIHEDVDAQAEGSQPSAASGRGVRFTEDASEGDAAASPIEGGGRSVRGRTPTGFIHEDVDAQSEGSQPSAASGRGVRFREDASEGDAAASPIEGGGRSVRGRTPTGFIHEDVDVQAEASQPSSASGRGVRFREEASEGVAAASPVAGGGRSVRGRTPTGFIHEDVDVDAEASQPSAASGRGVRFGEEASEGEAAASPIAGGGRSVHGRMPTGFVHEDVDVQAEERPGVRFAPDAAAPEGGGEARQPRAQRVPTGFVRPEELPDAHEERAGVRFAPDAAPEGGEARQPRAQRVPTGFVRPEELPEAQQEERPGVRFAADTAPEGGEARQPRAQRVPTGFVRPEELPDAQQDRSGVRFAADAEPVSEGDRQQRARRVPTGFVRPEDLPGGDTAASPSSSTPVAEQARAAVRFAPGMDVTEAASVQTADARPVRDRTPTGYVHEESLEPEGSRGVRFGGGVEVEAASSAATGPSAARDVKTRTPTGFVHAEELPQEQPSAGVRFAAAGASDEAAVAGDATANGLRSAKARTPTGYVRADDLPDTGLEASSLAADGGAVADGKGGVRFSDGRDDVLEAASTAPVGASRPVKGRIPTGYIDEANVPEIPNERRELKFAAGEQVLEAASRAPADGGRPVKDRMPTGYVNHEEFSAQVDPPTIVVTSPGKNGVDGSPGASSGPRDVKARTPTGFVHAEVVPKERGGVSFAPDVEEAAGVGSSGQARQKVKRIPTGFVRPEDIPLARAGLLEKTLQDEATGRKLGDTSPKLLTQAEGGGRCGGEGAPAVEANAGVRFAADSEPATEAPPTTPQRSNLELGRPSDSPCSPDEEDAILVCSMDSTASGTSVKKVTFRKQESIMNIEARERKSSAMSGVSSEGRPSFDSNDSAEASTTSPSQVGRRVALSLDDVQLATPNDDVPSYVDDDAASSCSSRNPRSRMSTPFISSVNLGFDCISQLINTEEEPAESPLDHHERRRQRMSSKGTSRLDTGSSVEEADRAVLKQASLESSIEREIAERVRNYAQSQRQAREERSALASAAVELRPAVVHATKGHAEQDLEKHLVKGATKEKELAMTALKKLPFFEEFNTDALEALIEAMEVYEFDDGDEVVCQGDTDGTHFFVVVAGEFLVLKDGKPRCTISPSNCFGESVLLLFGERSATVCAQGRATAYGMEGLTVRDMLQAHYEQRKTIVITAVDDVLNSGMCDFLAYMTNAYQLQTLYDQAETRSFAAGATLLAEGPPTFDGIMVLLTGKVSVVFKGEEIQDLERFAVCGDRALLFGEQPVTLLAKEPAEVLVLRRSLLDGLFGDELPKVFLRTRILQLLSHHRVFSRLHEDQREAVAAVSEVVTLRADEELDSDDLRFVAVLQGEVETRLADDGPSPEIRKYTGANSSTLGEENLLRRDVPWALRVRATGSSAHLATWRSQDLDSVITFDNLDYAIEHEDKVRILRSLILFKTLPRQQLTRLADALQILHVQSGTSVFQQGQIGTHFYIIRKGTVSIEIDGRCVRTVGLGDYFGERALLLSEPRSATVAATEDTELWEMNKETFQEIVHGPCVEYLTARIALQDTKVTFGDLEFLRAIGRGGFGVVKLVRARRTGVRYALKCVRKRHIVENGAQKALVTELSILAELDHPFIVKFVRPFRSPSKVYFLMEVVTGGELLDALDSLGILGHQHAQFYTGSILLALEFLHARQIAYLDLKSENCLVDHQGYLKIIDFGIAQRITRSKCHVMLGTPIIMAPEMIKGKGYTTVADLWSLGICLYDFVIGHFPFGSNATTKIQLYQDILQGELAFPGVFTEKPFSRDASSLIRGLLTRDPARRLGGGFEGYSAIKQHSFFKGFNWDALLGREITPPFLPKGETYGEDRELEAASAQPQTVQLLADEEAADTEDADWVDPSPDWDGDFDF